MNFRTLCLGLGFTLAACGSPAGEAAGALEGEAGIDSVQQALVSPLPTGNRLVSGTVKVTPPYRAPTRTAPASFTLMFVPINGARVASLVPPGGYSLVFTRAGDQTFFGTMREESWSKDADMKLELDPVTGAGKVTFVVIERTYTTQTRWDFTGTMQPSSTLSSAETPAAE